MYRKLVAVISKKPEMRTEFECQELVPWFRNKSSLLESLKPDIVSDVIRHCTFERRARNDVIIKQGASGDRLYIILKGQLSIYVVQDKEDVQEIAQQVERVCAKPDLDRDQLGQYVWTAGEGKTVGEVALLKDDCIRTATVVADVVTDLVIIDRALYSRSVRDVLEEEYQQKTTFVEKNPLFSFWPIKQRKLLIISLKKEVMSYGIPLARQGAKADNIFFLLSGETEITCNQSLFKGQYPELWREMETLLPGLLPRTPDFKYSPHEFLRRKRVQHKRLIQMCLLGVMENVGALEVLLGLESYIENSIVARDSDILVLSKENYDRLFNRKHAARTLAALRERLRMRLYLYIHRTDSMIQGDAPFFKFLTFMLQDDGALRRLKRMKQKEKEEREGTNVSNGADASGPKSKKKASETAAIRAMLKVLKVRPKTPYGRLPVVETGQRVINEIEEDFQAWVERSKGGTPDRERESPSPARSNRTKPRH